MYVDIGSARIYFDTVSTQLALASGSVSERPTLLVLHGGPGCLPPGAPALYRGLRSRRRFGPPTFTARGPWSIQ